MGEGRGRGRKEGEEKGEEAPEDKKKRIRRKREEADRKRFTLGYCCEGAVAMSPWRRS